MEGADRGAVLTDEGGRGGARNRYVLFEIYECCCGGENVTVVEVMVLRGERKRSERE